MRESAVGCKKYIINCSRVIRHTWYFYYVLCSVWFTATLVLRSSP
ncbi:DUF3265 domain-containing protein [Photobacterium kishitanii]|nr:DUF3265 domain-containing protein [Photobacterium kishitanii]